MALRLCQVSNSASINTLWEWPRKTALKILPNASNTTAIMFTCFTLKSPNRPWYSSALIWRKWQTRITAPRSLLTVTAAVIFMGDCSAVWNQQRRFSDFRMGETGIVRGWRPRQVCDGGWGVPLPVVWGSMRFCASPQDNIQTQLLTVCISLYSVTTKPLIQFSRLKQKATNVTTVHRHRKTPVPIVQRIALLPTFDRH